MVGKGAEEIPWCVPGNAFTMLFQSPGLKASEEAEYKPKLQRHEVLLNNWNRSPVYVQLEQESLGEPFKRAWQNTQCMPSFELNAGGEGDERTSETREDFSPLTEAEGGERHEAFHLHPTAEE
ncbi:hypothetical protein NDU88_003549 [Pleurodeles waltl]|uniref:Uncharacterized protein n=1 Tax=Pleurodeles waltl TaxID=8319 RepID=A0AAV7UYS2_PLEWA|nr:hypothetical protein NDU88_003549 [Pleurodeles waltl]